MKRKFLEDLLSSIEDETSKKDIIDKIMAENGNDINTEKAKTEVEKNNVSVKEKLIDELNKKIKENEDIDIETIKKEQYDLGKKDGSKEVETFKKSIALEKALTGTKAKDVKLLEKLLDSNKLSYEEKEGSFIISGLDDQIEELKTSHSYIFEEEKQNNSGINLGGEHSNNSPQNNVNSLLGALKEKYS